MATDDAPPLYLQIAEQLAQLIRNGTLARGEKLRDATPRVETPPLRPEPEDPEFARRARELADRARQALGKAGADPAPATRTRGGKPDAAR